MFTAIAVDFSAFQSSVVFEFVMLRIGRKEYEALRQHGEETYPHECCGVLLGQMLVTTAYVR